MCDLKRLTGREAVDMTPEDQLESKTFDAFVRSNGGADPTFIGSLQLDAAIKRAKAGQEGGGAGDSKP
jgi:hypothetical protein